VAQLNRFDLELIRVPTARHAYLFVTHIRLQTSSDYKLLMYVDMRQGQRSDFPSIGEIQELLPHTRPTARWVP
jgi:hypothetical protein